MKDGAIKMSIFPSWPTRIPRSIRGRLSISGDSFKESRAWRVRGACKSSCCLQSSSSYCILYSHTKNGELEGLVMSQGGGSGGNGRGRGESACACEGQHFSAVLRLLMITHYATHNDLQKSVVQDLDVLIMSKLFALRVKLCRIFCKLPKTK